MKFKISALLFIGALSLAVIVGQVESQVVPQPLAGQPLPAKAVDKGQAIMQALGLTDEQKTQLREMNKARKPLMQAAQRNFRDAMKALDSAIYADVFDEYAYSLRLADLQKAQAELQRLRFENEVNIRKILTPTQLDSFRNLRKRFSAEKKLRDANGDTPADRPIMQRLQRRQERRLQRPVARPTKPQ